MSTYDFEPDPSDYGPEPLYIANPTLHKQEPLKRCWYEHKEKTLCKKCGQVHADAIFGESPTN